MTTGPASLFAVWPDLAAALSRRPTSLFLDFDGTLLPFTQEPDAPCLSGQERTVLRRLARAPHCTVAIVSGRALRDVRRRVNVPGVVYAGNHGLEIEGRGLVFRHPAAVAAAGELAALRCAAARAIRRFPTARVEDKGLSWALHLRTVPPGERARVLRAFWQTVRPAAERGRVSVRPGSLIREVLPPVVWDKGSAVRWILLRLSGRSQPLVIYVGDDAGDEPAFAALGWDGISVVVGRRSRTRARFFLRDPGEVHRFIGLVSQVIDRSTPRSPCTRRP